MPPKDSPAGAVNPAKILQLSTAYWDSQTLLTANRMGLFALLAESSMTLEEVADALGIEPRATRLFLNACIALDLLQQDGARYSNSALSRTYLTPGRPEFLGDALRYSDDLYPTWGKLETALKSGAAVLPATEYTGDNEDQTRHFVYAMHNRAMGIGGVLAGLVDLDGRQRMIDVGGGPGTYSCLFAQRYPGLSSRVLDLPGVLRISREIIESMGLNDRVVTAELDYMQDEFPQDNDVVLISGVFHRETEETCRDFIKRARKALNPGGLLIISDVFADAGGASPLFATLFGLNMMLTAEHGGVHADTDVADWMQDEGFAECQRISFPPPMPHRVVTGVLP